MNGIWIRSQDKTELMCCERIYSQYYDGTNSTKAIFARCYDLQIKIGEYATFTRALQVLDEIHTRINMDSSGVYIMPAE